MNYGAIGAVIGHEIIHGYDDQGRKFDADGNLRDWWTPADAANYDQRDSCITDEYTQDVPEAGVKQNGKLSAGEDTADNGGIHIALAGLQSTLQVSGQEISTQPVRKRRRPSCRLSFSPTPTCGAARFVPKSRARPFSRKGTRSTAIA